jgi:uncharacterized protein (DUF1501 family)
MAINGKAPVLVVVQLSGGNDFMNTLIPYTNGVYYDSRPTLSVPPAQVLPINDTLGFHPNAGPLKELYDQGKMAIVQGIGYPNSNRSHFRGMDIWHTCEPDRLLTEGWLGKAIRELDPHKDNVLTGVSFGRGLPRAMVAPGVPVTSVGDLDTYGLLTGMADLQQRQAALTDFHSMYAATGKNEVMDYLAYTGLDVLTGVDIIKKAPAMYTSKVTYADNPIAKSLRDVARVHTAHLGTRVFYTQHGGYDTHATQLAVHPRLLSELSGALRDFMQDLRDHQAAEEVAILVFTEFGRRIKDNGSGSDHGSGGGAFLIGERVKGGLYAEYPSLDPAQQLYGEDLRHTCDFRGVYATLLEQWMGLAAPELVRGTFEQLHPFLKN